MNDFNDLPEWDLSTLYSSMDDVAIAEDKTALIAAVNGFTLMYKGKLNEDTYESSVIEYERISEGIDRLLSYAGLLFYACSDDESVSRFYQQMQEELTPLYGDLAFYPLELAALPVEWWNSSRYAPWLRRLQAHKPYMLGEVAEQLILEKNLTGRQAWIRFYDQTLAAMTFDFQGKQCPLEEVVSPMGGADAALRKEAALSLHAGLKTAEPLFTTVTNVLAKDKESEDKRRGYKGAAMSRHVANDVDEETVNALHKAVTSRYEELSHRYYRLKAKALGVAKLEYWDRNAPLAGDDDAALSWDEARQIVLDTFDGFDPGMGAIARRFFDDRRIDAPCRTGKTSGAFSHPTVPSAHPYILVNFQGKRRDVMTLAHELGHGVHQVLSAPQGHLLCDTPLTVAETASVFAEMLTFQALKQACPDEAGRKSLLAGKIDDMLNTVVRQIAFYDFELAVHRERREGELSSARLDALWLETQAKALGDSVSLDPVTANFWSYISHFIHSPFYVYAYAFGDCLVNALYRYYTMHPEGFTAKYLEVLQAGGTKRYDVLFKNFGFDLRDPGFWNLGLDLISSYIDEFEGLTA